MNDQILFIIDPRLGPNQNDKLPKLPDLLPSSSYVMDTLSSGDVMFTGIGPHNAPNHVIGIEMKTPDDFVSSRVTGRLARQLRDMMSPGGYDERWLVIVGKYRPTKDGRLEVSRRYYDDKAGKEREYWTECQRGRNPVVCGYIDSFAATIQDFGIHFHRVDSLEHFVVWLKMLYEKRQKPWEEQCAAINMLDVSGTAIGRSMDVRQGGYLPLNPPERDRELEKTASALAAWPGLRDRLAIAAAKHFGSIYNAATASIEEWACVKTGIKTKTDKDRVIGPTVASKVVRFVRGKQ